MNHEIKMAFDQVKADSALKNTTADFVLRSMAEKRKSRIVSYRPVAVACACMLFLMILGYQTYFKPTTSISIDINPSVMLEVNRFNRVVSYESYNDDGAELMDSLDIKFKNYAAAVDQIMNSETICELLSKDEIMTIAVLGNDSRQSEEIYAQLQSSTNESASVYCYYAKAEDAAKAREMGLSYSRYQAYLILQEEGYAIEADELNAMTMREIRDMIYRLTGEVGETSAFGKGQHGQGNNKKQNHS